MTSEKLNRRRTDNCRHHLTDPKTWSALASMIAAVASLIIAMKNSEKLETHKEAIIQNSDAIKAVGQVQSDVTGLPNVAETVIPESPLEGKKQ